MFIQDRLISRSSRSLAVTIGFARSAKGDGQEGLRGSPDDALKRFVPLHHSRNTSASVNPG